MENGDPRFESIPPKPKIKRLRILNVLVAIGVIVTAGLLVNMIIIALDF